MKKTIFILITFAIVSCNRPEENKKLVKTIEVKKIVIGKTQQLDSYYNIFTEKQVTRTLFTIAYNDGTEQNVSFAEYAKAKEGDTILITQQIIK